jgi:hypothetical protein
MAACTFFFVGCPNPAGTEIPDTKSYKTVTDFSDLSGLSAEPRALKCDGAGGLYVTGGNSLYQISGDGVPSLFLENTTGNEPFNAPRGMTIGGDGCSIIANNLNRDILRIYGGTAEFFWHDRYVRKLERYAGQLLPDPTVWPYDKPPYSVRRGFSNLFIEMIEPGYGNAASLFRKLLLRLRVESTVPAMCTPARHMQCNTEVFT